MLDVDADAEVVPDQLDALLGPAPQAHVRIQESRAVNTHLAVQHHDIMSYSLYGRGEGAIERGMLTSTSVLLKTQMLQIWGATYRGGCPTMRAESSPLLPIRHLSPSCRESDLFRASLVKKLKSSPMFRSSYGTSRPLPNPKLYDPLALAEA